MTKVTSLQALMMKLLILFDIRANLIYDGENIKGASSMGNLTVNDFFCGCGGMGIGFLNAGFSIVGAWDINEPAIQTYVANVGTHAQQKDIQTMHINDIPKAHVWAMGFPCQDVSYAGKRAGIALLCQDCNKEFDIKDFDDFNDVCVLCGSSAIKPATRSGLFFEIMRLVDEAMLFDKSKAPKVILAENVKAIRGYIPALEREFTQRGYKAYSVLFNSKYWGVAQHRERYFIVGVHKSIDKEFQFPIENKTNLSKLSDFLDADVDEKYYVSPEKADQIIAQALERLKELGYVHATLTPTRVKKRQQGRRAKADEEPMFTLTAQDLHGIIIDDTFGYNKGSVRVYTDKSPTLRHGRHGLKTVESTPHHRVRTLTPTEYGRLQGFPMANWKQVVSNTEAYRQFGNAVTTTVVTAIANEIKQLL